MKYKFLALLLTVALTASGAVALSGCETSNNNQNSVSSTNSSSNNITSNTEHVNIYLSTPPTPVTLTLREREVTITDAGRIDQQMDIAKLSDYYNKSDLFDMIQAGYSKLKVTLTIDVREVDDGYQYIFLYYNKECRGNGIFDKIENHISNEEDSSLLYTWKFEHGSGGKNTSWETYTFTTTVPMSSIVDDLYIRYGASGKYDDDWRNKNVSIVLEPFKPQI